MVNVPVSFKTYRSDMGCQVYELAVNTSTGLKHFVDSYYPPEAYGRAKIIFAFSDFMKEIMFQELKFPTRQ